MVCVPCIVIPFLLYVFHKWVQPFILKFWNPWANKTVEANPDDKSKEEYFKTKEGQFILECITENPVMVFSKTTCNFCKMAKKVLDETGVNYAVEELDSREDCSAIQDTLLKITGARTVPRVFVEGQCIGGGTETWSLHNQGKLMPMFKEAGATFKKLD